MQFTQHTERMYYPQFRERLRRIAAEEQIQVQWLRDQILALGGQPPVDGIAGEVLSSEKSGGADAC